MKSTRFFKNVKTFQCPILSFLPPTSKMNNSNTQEPLIGHTLDHEPTRALEIRERAQKTPGHSNGDGITR